MTAKKPTAKKSPETAEPLQKSKTAATKKSPAQALIDKQALADCRARLDQIDANLHDMLKLRADIIDEVRKIKGKQTIYIRPGREAQILRSLAARAQGKIPEGLIVRLWREMMSGFLLHEGRLAVSVYAPEKGLDLWDMARDHFGAFTPLSEAKTAQDAIRMVLDDQTTVAFVPLPVVDEKDPWWPLLIDTKNANLFIFQIAPFETPKNVASNARRSLPAGVMVGKLFPELTGDDHSFLAMQTVHVPEAEMRRVLSKAGYKVLHLHIQTKGRSGSAPSHILAEVDGYVGRADTRLERLRAMLGSRLTHLAPLGGYAVPLKSGRR